MEARLGPDFRSRSSPSSHANDDHSFPRTRDHTCTTPQDRYTYHHSIPAWGLRSTRMHRDAFAFPPRWRTGLQDRLWYSSGQDGLTNGAGWAGVGGTSPERRTYPTMKPPNRVRRKVQIVATSYQECDPRNARNPPHNSPPRSAPHGPCPCAAHSQDMNIHVRRYIQSQQAR